MPGTIARPCIYLRYIVADTQDLLCDQCRLNDGGSRHSWTDGAKDSAACTLTDMEHMGVGQRVCRCASASTCISYIDVTDVQHVGG